MCPRAVDLQSGMFVCVVRSERRWEEACMGKLYSTFCQNGGLRVSVPPKVEDSLSVNAAKSFGCTPTLPFPRLYVVWRSQKKCGV